MNGCSLQNPFDGDSTARYYVVSSQKTQDGGGEGEGLYESGENGIEEKTLVCVRWLHLVFLKSRGAQ